MIVRSGSPRVHLGEAPYANSVDEKYRLSDAEDDRLLGFALSQMVARLEMTNSQAAEVKRIWGEKHIKSAVIPSSHYESNWKTNPPWFVKDDSPESDQKSGAELEQRAKDAAAAKDNTVVPFWTSAKAFKEWFRCDNAEGGPLLPNSWARSICYTRNVVMGAAAVGAVAILITFLNKISPSD